MPRVKTMTQLIQILIRLKKGESIRKICKETGNHRNVIRKVKEISSKKGWLVPTVEIPSERDMELAYNEPEKDALKPHVLDNHKADIEQYLEDEKSFVVIHRLVSEFADCCGISETTVRRYIHRQFPETRATVMIRPLEDGVMEVDFGYLGFVYDPFLCKKRKAWVFSGRLRKSRKAYRETVYDQKSGTFFKCHIRAFHHFGGVPKKIVPDNLKSAVVRDSFYDPVINRGYHELAMHYDFLISPCKPAKPMHKGGVESDIRYIKNNFWPYFTEKQKQKGHQIPLSTDLEESLKNWDMDTADVRLIKGVGKSPRELFVEESKSLSKLPIQDWDVTDWKECIVRPEWLIQYDCSYYSVPFKYVGEKVMVCANSSFVKIFYGHVLIAIYERAQRKWEYKRNKYHAPPHQEEYLDMTNESLIAWAGSIGKSTLEVIERIFSHKHIDGLRPARSLLFLSKKFSKERLEAACKRAIYYETPTYRSVKNILDKKLDGEDYMNDETKEINYLPFRFARDNSYYKY